MKKLFQSKKFIGFSSLVLATSLVLGTIAVRRTKTGVKLGIPTVNAASDLLDYDSSSQVNYSTILGRASDYGILTRNLNHLHHMQTTFATSEYTGGKFSCDANLSGPAAAQFIVADMTGNSTLSLDDMVYMQHMNYVVDTTYELSVGEVNGKKRISTPKPDLIEILPRTYSQSTLNQNIDSMIGHIQTESAKLAAKPAINIDDVLTQSPTDASQYILDLDDPAYEGATIYFDVDEGSPFLRAMGDNLTIKKRASTVIVFNVKGSSVTLKQIKVQVGNETHQSNTDWQSPMNAQNTFVDEQIARKIVWNLTEATDVTLDTCAGAFLVPTEGAFVDVTGGPSAGWIACAGTTNIEKVEFHFVFTDRSEEGNDVFNSYMHFATKKAFTSDFTAPNDDANVISNVRILQGDYSFSLTEMTDYTYSTPIARADNPMVVQNDEFGKVTFPSLTVDVTQVDPRDPLHRYFVIKESANQSRDPHITNSTGEIDIDMEIRNIEGIIHYYITSYHYATAEDKAAGNFYKKNNAVEMSGTEFSLGGFYNKYDVEKASLQITKKVTFENNNSEGFPTDKKFKVEVKKGAQYVQDINGTIGGAKNYFEISANETLTINDLTLGDYTIIEDETDVGDFELSTTYSAQNITLANKNEVGEATITNHYTKLDNSNKAKLILRKTIDINGSTMNLPNAFKNKEYTFYVRAVKGSEVRYVKDNKGTLEYSPQPITVTAGQDVVITGLDPSYTYSVEEFLGYGPQRLVSVEGYEFLENDSTLNVNGIDIPAGGEDTAEIINKYEKKVGYLKITKQFVLNGGNNQYSALDAGTANLDLSGLKFHVTGPDGFNKTVAWSEFSDGEYTFPDPVPQGKYTITEENPSATGNATYTYVSTVVRHNNDNNYAQSENINVGPGENTPANARNAIVRNIYQETSTLPKGSIRIQKMVNPSTVSTTEFYVYITTTENGQVKYCKFDAAGNFVSADAVSAGQSLNDYRVTITANGGNGQILVQNLPMGTYTVTEDEDAAKITGMHLGISYENQTVTLSENNRQKDTIIRNNYTDYSLKVKKVVTGTPPYNNNTYEYAIKCGDQYVQANGQLGSNIHYFTIAAGEEQEVVLFQTGDYSVVERFANWAMEGTEKAKDYNIHYSMQTTYSSDSVTVNGQNETGEITITNHYTHNVEKGSLTVSKTEAGDIPATGKPSSYTFYVKCGTQYVQDDSTGALGTDPVAFTVSTTGDKVIDGLDLNKTYIVEEVAVTGLPEGYTCAATYSESSVTLNSTDKDGSIAITNTYTYTAPETVEATVKKVWDDNDNQDGIRPASLTVDLLKNGTKIDEVTLNAGNNWSATKSGLKKYDNGVLNVYTWSEPTITGYTSATTTQDTVTTFTNTHAPEEISVSVKKIWNDYDNVAKKRPASLTVTLSNGTAVTLNAANNWTAKVEHLPKYANGTKITYTWSEGTMPIGYYLDGQSVDDSDPANPITTITNTYDQSQDTTTASVEKIWVDNNDQDGKRPAEVTFDLLRNGQKIASYTVKESDGWKKTVNDLPMYNGATVYTYSWAEQAVADYTSTASAEGPDMTFTNTHAPETTSVSVKKIWDDKNDVAGKRPANLIVTLSNGTEVTLNESNNWTATVNDLPKYANGTEITYTWTEKNVPAGYAVTSNTQDANDPSLTNITNYYDLNQETTSLSITKDWDDFNNAAGKRPVSLTVELYADGVLSTTVTLKATENWTATVSGLPIYDPTTGAKITYDWSEGTMPAGYSLKSVATGTTSTTITNTYDLSRELIKVTVHKDWDDENNLAGKRPANLTVNLSNGDQVVLNDANGWTASVNDLPKFDALGNEISYTWTEDTLDAGYSISAYTDDPSDPTNPVTTIVNTFDLTQEKTSASVEKIWDDNNNQDGQRPNSLAVTLLQNGTSYRSVILDESNNWKAAFDDLPKFNGTDLYTYTWEEQAVTGYTSSASTPSADMKFTNTHAPELISLSVKKVWEDFDNVAGKRPDSLTVTLSNGTEVTLNEANNWTATVDNLPKYADGNEINYTWTEGNMPTGYSWVKTETSSADPALTVITNTYDQTLETTSATVTKVWNDNNDQDGMRPTELTVDLLRDGTAVDHVTLNEGNGWTATLSGLPKYNGAATYNYSWAEPSVTGYTTASTAAGADMTFTNTHVTEKTSASVQKIWDDKNDVAGKRPAELTVTLDQTGDVVVLNESNSWTATITDLPKYNNGTEITYTWTEDLQTAGYTQTGAAIDTVNPSLTKIVNEYDLSQEETTASVKKVWNDFNNAAGKRPASLTVTLSNGTPVTLNEANGWSATVENLPKFDTATGALIVYTWSEGSMPEGYTLTDTSVSGQTTTLTNTYDLSREKTSARIQKIWDDNNNLAGKRPSSLKVTLSDGTEVTLDAAHSWTATLTDLPKFDAQGNLIVYTWTEDTLPAGYTMTSNEVDASDATLTTITNKYDLTVEVTSASVEKVWNDSDNQDGKRPDYLTVDLLNNGVRVDSVTLNKSNGWKGTVNNLPKYTGTQLNNYTWSEPVITGYTSASSKKDETTTVLTNTHETEKVKVSVTKVWDDNGNIANKRPSSLTVTLTNTNQTVVLNEANSWTASISDLPKYAGGVAIDYTWSEGTLSGGYSLKDSTLDTTDPTTLITTITNTYDQSIDKTSATVEKVWNDSNNQDGKRPANLTVKLYKDGSEYTSVTLNSANNWKQTVNNLPMYDGSKVCVYTWEEQSITGYTSSSTKTDATTTVITNTHVTETTKATVKKVWDDKNNLANARPSSLFVTLVQTNDKVELNEANNWTATIDNLPKYSNGTEITYTWTEDLQTAGYTKTGETVSADGITTTITNKYDLTLVETSVTVKKVWADNDNTAGKRPASLVMTLSNGQSVTLTAANSWTGTISGLQKYTAAGDLIDYTWTEAVIANYTQTSAVTDSNGVTTFTNTYTAPEVTSATVQKVWNDSNNQDGKRPASLTVKLLQDGTAIETKTLNDANNWTVTIGNLPKFDGTREIEYTWWEEDVNGYTQLTEKTGTTTTLTNTHTAEVVTLSVKKDWNDNNNAANKRPSSLTVTLTADGTSVASVVLNDTNSWQASVSNLAKCKNGGTEIVYAWTEPVVTDYELDNVTVTANGLTTFVNKLKTVEMTEASVVKVWDDSNNQDGKRPNELKVQLLADGSQIKETTLNANNGWKATFDNLPKVDAAGNTINYTWTEDSVTGYTLRTSKSGTTTTLTNTHAAEEVDISVKKVWDDNNNAAGQRPTELKVQLLKDGIKVDEVALSDANGWSYTYTQLPKYDNGTEISYTWKEASLPAGYTASTNTVSGVTTITNKYTVVATTSATVKKVWNDSNNQDGLRPTELTVQLLKNGSYYSDVTLSEANNWTATVDNLPAKDGATDNDYSWLEDSNALPAGYTLTAVDQVGTVTTLTNTHVASTIDLTVVKVWDDAGAETNRPTDLTVKLMANGSEKTTVTLNDGNSWTASVTGLPEYDSGAKINYSWVEGSMPAGYTMKSSQLSTDGLTTTITNTYDLSREKTSATVKKVWDDNNNADQKRPSSLQFTLSNGTVVTLSDANNWEETVDNLPKFDSNKNLIVYTWTEGSMPADYSQTSMVTSADGLTTTFTNTYTKPAPVKGSLKVTKALGADAPADASSKSYKFTVTGTKGYVATFEIQGAGSHELTDLELDTYTVTEDKDGAEIKNYDLTVSNSGASVELTDATQKEIVITNTYTKSTQPSESSSESTSESSSETSESSSTSPTGTKSSDSTGTQPTESSAPSENDATRPSEGDTPTPTPDKEIVSVTIDDTPVSPEDYKKKPDGTVEFTPETIEGLTLGVHRAVIKYKDGSSYTIEFEVITSARGKQIVKTGDVGGQSMVPVATLFIAASAAVVVVLLRKRRTERHTE